MDKKKILSYAINTALILLLFLAVFKYTTHKDVGIYNFCVEWETNIYREDLLWKCFNFEDGKPICDWDIDTKNTLVIFDYYNKSDYISFGCTRLAKTSGATKKVDISQVLQ